MDRQLMSQIIVQFSLLCIDFFFFSLSSPGEIGIFDHLLQNSKKYYDDVLQQRAWGC